MPGSAQPEDVLLYVNSHHILRTLPPGAHDEVAASLSASGSYSTPAGGPNWGYHVGRSSTTQDAARWGGKPVEGDEFSEDDLAAMELVWKKIREKRKVLHIVDVGKETGFHRYIEEHRHHLTCFPVLVRPDGRRLEGLEQFTDPNLESFLADLRPPKPSP